MPICNPFKDNFKRGVPQNVKVFEPIFKQGNLRLIEGLKSLRWNSLFVKEFFYEKVYSDSFKFKKWLNSLFLYKAGIDFFKFSNS